jgi:hypothetical protein
MAKATTKTVAPKIATPDTQPMVIAPLRPHSMPRRLMNVPASRTDTAGKETPVKLSSEG